MFTAEQAQSILKKEIGELPPLLIILGSGWNSILKDIHTVAEIEYEQLFGVKSSVPGHDGKLIVGQIGEKKVALMAGRLHMYEGYTAEQVTLPIRVSAACGVKQVFLTAAVGALNPKYKVGDFVVLSDLLTLLLSLDNPLKGPKFQDMSEIFDADMRKQLTKILVDTGMTFHEGVYAYYHGPNFETPADKMALRMLGGDIVGMSTAPETIMARWLNLNIVGLAFVTNLAFVKHNHTEVIAQAEAASTTMVTVLKKFIEKNELD